MGLVASVVCDRENLHRAWREVRAQVVGSAWPSLLEELHELERAPLGYLDRLRVELLAGEFQFSPKLGYAKRKSGGSRRGITIPCVRDRIVQRAILQVLYSTEPARSSLLGAIPAVLRHPASFAGTPGRGVPEAVTRVSELLRGGATAFAYSDMKDFFPRVPRHDVIEFVRTQVEDGEFGDLFAGALDTELANPAELAEWLELFPSAESGVAQGSLLSVAAANLALRRFDARFDGGDCALVRYLDDFVLLAPSVAAARQAFATARQELSELGMECYAPGDGSQKAAWGEVREGFDFLGCRIHPDGVSPARRNGRRLLREVRQILAAGRREIERFAADAERRRDAEPAYLQTLARVDRQVRGWGDAYRFVTNRVTFAQLDAKLDRLLADFQAWFARRLRAAPAASRRRMTGLARLGDVPPK